MKRINYLSIIACFLFLACVKPNWQGNYLCEAQLGEAAAQQAVITEYELNIDKDKCILTINGFQVSESIVCKADQDKKALHISFVSYADGSTKNQYGVVVHRVGDTLFSLTGDPSDEFMTHWDTLWPGKPVAKQGKYFIKEN